MLVAWQLKIPIYRPGRDIKDRAIIPLDRTRLFVPRNPLHG